MNYLLFWHFSKVEFLITGSTSGTDIVSLCVTHHDSSEQYTD